MSKIVSLDRLSKEEYGRVICYPRCDPEEFEKRLAEIAQLGVTALEFTGKKSINSIPVLGKGCVGIVILAYTDFGRTALKIRRTDADRAGMRHEAEMLRTANSVNVGPKLLGSSENLLKMEFVDGIFLQEWIETYEGEEDKEARIRRLLVDILEQCWRLDDKGLDHGELSQAAKHILIEKDGKACFLDFETASVTRKVSNVTSICHFLFMGGKTADLVTATLGEMSKEDLIAALRRYKKNGNRQNFEAILRICLPDSTRLKVPWRT